VRRGRRRAPRAGVPLAAGLAARVTVLVALVLLGAGFAVTVALRGFLVERVDQQLIQIAAAAPQSLYEVVPGGDGADPEAAGSGPSAGEAGEGSPALLRPHDGTLATPQAVAILIGSDGRVLSISTGPGDGDDMARPAGLAAAAVGLRPGVPVDVLIGEEPYRVVALAAGDATVAVALPLDQVAETVARLALAEGLVGLAALLLVALGSWLLVRRGLRPLGRIATRARSLAAADLSLPRTGERDTVAVSLRAEGDPAEVAALGDSLEAMLGHIDASLTARDEAEARLRRFVSDASHELRTPLQSIRGYAELQRRGVVSDPAAVAATARRIEEESIRMGRLVDDLLLLARLDQGRPLVREPLDLCALAADAVADAQVADPNRPIALVVPASDVRIEGDADRMRQVLANLLANASGHTPAATPVSVSVTTGDDGALLRVADLGPGIPAEALPHVFDRFFRADPGRSRDRGGTGLGLALVRSIVEAHGGDVELESGPAGTVVTVRLPALTTQEASATTGAMSARTGR
jgi:two-component system, OmpR family, sensor kinase